MGSTPLNSLPAIAWAAPIFASIVTFIGVVITLVIQNRSFRNQLASAHASKLTEMRQEWISDLRNAMASFHSYAVTPGLDQAMTREFYESGTKIELFMNPADPDFADLQNSLYDYLRARTTEEKYKANPRFIDVCQRILRREWLTLKSELAVAHRIPD